jgi:TetR/AcrR family transcriptional repressor of mexJK operon
MSQDQKQDLRREVIIEAAIKRFAHFGVGKTTMTEIGNDLSLSKASLYYYFPDKLSLYAAVLRTITQQTEKKDDEWLQKESDPKKAILLFLDMRTDFIIKYHNILEYLRNYTPATIPPPLDSIFVHLRHRELRRITDIIEKGRTSGQFSIENSEKVAELFFDFLDGFRHTVFSRNGTVFPDKKQFQSILKKEKEFAAIFFNGLSV